MKASFELPGSHQRGQLLVYGLHDLLAGREALQDFLAQRPLAHVGDELLDHLEVDVGLEQRETDLAHGARDRLFVQLPPSSDVAERALQAV